MKSILCLLLFGALHAENKIVICGVCKNIAPKLPIVMKAMTAYGEAYDDYQIIVYENNSDDTTPQILKGWAKRNPKVTVFTEKLTSKELRLCCPSRKIGRTEVIAMARNRVLLEAIHPQYDDFDFIFMVDMDFREVWDIDAIVETTSRTDIEWDGVFANGQQGDGSLYDILAYRSEAHPLGPECLGRWWWVNHNGNRIKVPADASWIPVYSAFGGCGIYKRSSIKGSWYSGVVTTNLETVVKQWLAKAQQQNHEYVQVYKALFENTPIYSSRYITKRSIRELLPGEIGLTISETPDAIIWLHDRKKALLPEVCEHVTLHANMICKGHKNFFINPKLITHRD